MSVRAGSQLACQAVEERLSKCLSARTASRAREKEQERQRTCPIAQVRRVRLRQARTAHFEAPKMSNPEPVRTHTDSESIFVMPPAH